MRHTMLTFRLHLRGVVFAALGALLAAVLLLVGGCLLGQWRAARAAAALATSAGGTGAAGAGVAGAEAGAPGAAAPSPSTLDQPPGMPDRYTLRLGAFPTEEEAKALADRLSARGYAPTLGRVQGSAGATLHLVLVGSYDSLWEARGAAAELERREAMERRHAVVVPAPQ